MKYLPVIILAWLLMAFAVSAQPQPGGGSSGGGPGPVPPTSGGNYTGPVTLNGGGNITNLGFQLAPKTLVIAAPGSGYAQNDMVTLSCPGATFASGSPNIAITGVSSGTVTSIFLSFPPASSPTANGGTVQCIQNTTTGAGSGLTVNGQFVPVDAQMSIQKLGTGGGAANGNTLVNGTETLSTSYSGAEGTFFGDKAGGAFIGAATANSAFGHNACGQGTAGAAPSGSGNNCFGDDAARNITGTANGNVIDGQGAAENISGNNNLIFGNSAVGTSNFSGSNNVLFGANSGTSMTTAADNVIAGQGSGTALTQGAENLILGWSAGNNVTTGSRNIILGSNCNGVPANNTNDEFVICDSGNPVMSITGMLTPGTSLYTVYGLLSFQGTAPAVSACGTSPSIDGHATNNSGTVTVGTGAAASCTVTFANSGYATWNHCRVTPQSTLAAFGYTYTKTVLTVTGTTLTGASFDYNCDGA